MPSIHRPSSRLRCAFVLALVPALATLLPLSSQAAGAEACVVKNRSERVAVVVCPAGLPKEQWRAAGMAACKNQTGGCNAWIWDDASKAPAKAPAVDTDMPKSVTGSARAVWVNETQGLIELRKAP